MRKATALKEQALKEQFDDLAQQHEADRLGMWIFLSTELLLFGGLFLGYTVYRTHYPAAWAAGSHHNKLWIGTLNTAILLASSLTVALAVHAAEARRRKPAVGFLLATIALGLVFLFFKFYEYYLHYRDGFVPVLNFTHDGPEMSYVAFFFVFYFLMTGLHALHMIVGLGLVSVVAFLTGRGKTGDHMPVELTGLYWHLIDIFWVFLYPLFYLVG